MNEKYTIKLENAIVRSLKKNDVDEMKWMKVFFYKR